MTNHSIKEFSLLSRTGAAEAMGHVRVYEPGHLLFSQGDPCSGIFTVVSGIVGLRRLSEDGSSALFQLIRPGQMVGHAAFLANADFGFSAEVLTLARIRFLERGAAQRLCNLDASLYRDLVSRAMADLDHVQSRCAALLTQDLKTRLLDTLMSFRDGDGTTQDPVVVDLPIQRKDLASLIGAAPESLSRLIGKLEAEGTLLIEGRRFHLLQASAKPSVSPPSQTRCMLDALMRARTALLSLLNSKDVLARSALEQEIEHASAILDEMLKDASAAPPPLVASFMPIWEAFKDTRRSKIIPAVKAGRMTQARGLAMGVQAHRLAKMKCVLHQGVSIAA